MDSMTIWPRRTTQGVILAWLVLAMERSDRSQIDLIGGPCGAGWSTARAKVEHAKKAAAIPPEIRSSILISFLSSEALACSYAEL